MGQKFRTGDEAVASASKGASFAKTHYLSLDDGEQVLVRFLTDKQDWIVVDQHNSVPTKAKPDDWPKDATWPTKMGAVCRKDVGVRDITGNECFICDHIVGTVKEVKRASARTWALAVLREEVKENGQVVGVKDQTREVNITDKDGKATGEVKEEKAVVVVNMGYKNFFSVLQGFGSHFGTVVDRDYFIKRVGKEMDTLYQIIPNQPIVLSDGTILDLRNPKFADRYPLTQELPDIVMERASDEFYARFFDTRVKAPATKTSTEAGVPAKDAPQAAGSEVSSEDLKALAARVKGHPAATADPAPAPAPAPAPEPPVEAPASAPASGMRDFG